MSEKPKDFIYHATRSNLIGTLMVEGLKPGWDGAIYFAETEQDALKFMAIKMHMDREFKEVVVVQIEVSQLDESQLYESFDHSYEFFQCRSWAYLKDVPSYAIVGIEFYGLGGGEDAYD